MTGFVLSPAARADIEAIWGYTAQRWGPEQAERYLRLLQAACEDLAHGRRRGRSAEHIRPGYLRAEVGSHILFFRHTQAGVIDIIRILHRRMDTDRHL
jgi:toxin ParE1/3/4